MSGGTPRAGRREATALPQQVGTEHPPPRAGDPGALRITWVQPEDLVAHELRQAAEDGRDPAAVATVAAAWEAVGGTAAPPAGGASPAPAGPRLRAAAGRLLDELAALTCDTADREPTDLPAVLAACPDWPVSSTGRGGGTAATGGPGPHRWGPGAPGGAYEDALHAARPAEAATATARTDTPRPGATASVRAYDTHPDASSPTTAYEAALATAPTNTPHPGPAASATAYDTRSDEVAPATAYEDALHAAWLGRAAGCLLGKPVERLPLAGIRALAAATGNWPLRSWFTAEGLPAELARAHPWNRRSAPTSLAENIDGMPEDDDLNYPLLNLLLLRRHGRGFRTRDVAALWLDELPAGRTFTAERIAYRNLLCGIEPPLTARYRNPFREWIGAGQPPHRHREGQPPHPPAAPEPGPPEP
ncbi:hypothetical protein ACFW15_35085, partial [Streptomyces sp. NPDC058953]